MPADIAEAIRQAYAELGGGDLPVAIRSSATAEDLPGMSFAGQQETYLNVRGEARVLEAVKRCWASLWTARAIGYRARNGIAPEAVSLARGGAGTRARRSGRHHVHGESIDGGTRPGDDQRRLGAG